MLNTLLAGAIGIEGLSLEEQIKLAAATGFDAVNFSVIEVKELADANGGIEYVRNLFSSNGIKPGGWGVPVNAGDDSKRPDQILALPELASLAVALGAPGGTSGIMPGNNEREYDAEYAFWQERFLPVAEALKSVGASVGIEFIAPKTLRNRFTYEFIYDMPRMLQFGKELGTGNVGVLFDLWHHYTAHGTVEELDLLKVEDVILVHVNDAPAGIEIDEQLDNQRTLPMETGVIPAIDYMKKLKALGYSGPVAAEPFSDRLNAIGATDPTAAAKETASTTQSLLDAI
ncbi:MAG: sugar phosphate isomerase/epimerase family protein [Thermomicrobiales bacterium]